MELTEEEAASTAPPAPPHTSHETGASEREQLVDTREDAPDRDGSDSGLGSDAAGGELQTLDAAFAHTDDDSDDDKFLSQLVSFVPHAPDPTLRPRPGNLKRSADEADGPAVKRPRKSIGFDGVTVYYFPRTQGFTCVPSQGGSTLGMERRHSHVQRFSLHEHAAEQRRLHRLLLQQRAAPAHLSSDDSDTDDEPSDDEAEPDLDGYYFLQPVPTRRRRAMLRAAGVRRIEPREKDECRDIRLSREFCGCACKGHCSPDACLCSVAGIKCQVDRLDFPCGCARDTCGNTAGRVEFDPVRVQTHFVRTLVRLGLERSEEEQARRTADARWVPHAHYADLRAGASAVAYSAVPDLHAAAERSPSHLSEMNVGARVDAYAHGESGSPYVVDSAYDTTGFPCDLGYRFPESRSEGFPSFSATTFEEFAHPAHISMFNHYGRVYVPESYATPAADTAGPNYVADCTRGGDENWYSATSAAGTERAPVEAEVTAPPVSPAPSPSPSENLGELIRKTMVESVIG